MHLLACHVAIVAVTVIYLFWRGYAQSLLCRQRILRERVAYLLWVLADADEASPILEGAHAFDNPADVT